MQSNQQRGSSLSKLPRQLPQGSNQFMKDIQSQKNIKSRLYDTGFKQNTMPSVKRPQIGQQEKMLTANLASYKSRQVKQENIQRQPQSIVLHNQDNNQRNNLLQTLGKTQGNFMKNQVGSQMNDEFERKMQQLEQESHFMQLQDPNKQLESIKRARTAKKRIVSNKVKPDTFQGINQLQSNLKQQQQTVPIQYNASKSPDQRNEANFFKEKPKSAIKSSYAPKQGSTMQKKFQNMRASTALLNKQQNTMQQLGNNGAYINQYQIEDEDYSSPQKQKILHQRMRIQSGLATGVDYKEHINQTREIFGIPRGMSGKTLPPMSAQKRSTNLISAKLSKVSGNNNYNNNDQEPIIEDLDIQEEAQNNHEYIDLDLEKREFDGTEKLRTGHLIDKISGKQFIDKRYIKNGKIVTLQDQYNNEYGEEDDLKIHQNQPDLNKEEEQYILQSLKKLREPTKLDKYIDLILKNVTNINEFVYLVKRKADDPYDLQVVSFKNIIESRRGEEKKSNGKFTFDKKRTFKEHYTISKKGLCHYINGKPVEFIQLAYWLKERETYDEITQLSFFQNFRRWKTLKMWRKNVVRHKSQQYAKNLEEKLFVLNPIMRKTLLDFRNITFDMMNKQRFIALGDDSYSAQDSTFTLEQFKELQEKKRKDINEKIQQQSKECRKIVMKGFGESLERLKKNQYMNTKDKDGTSKKQQNLLRTKESKESAYEKLGFSDSMNYEQRSELRKECSRFLRFAYLVDFLAMESLSNIFKNSVELLQEKITGQVLDSSIFIVYQDSQQGQPNEIEPLFKVAIKENFEPIYDGIEIQELEEFMPHPYGDHTAKNFNPLYHMHLKRIKEKKEEPEGLKKKTKVEESDTEYEEDIPNEENTYERRIVPNITQKWLRINPDRNAFFNDLMKCIAEGANSIQAFERWSRHEDMLNYVNVLEEWDDMVGDDWDSPDSNYLNPSEWLAVSPSEMFEETFKKLINSAFDRVELYIFSNFKEFLLNYWENDQLDFLIYQNELLANPGTSYKFTIEKLKILEEQFKNKVPMTADQGLIKVDTSDLRIKLFKQPQQMLQKFAEFVPPMLQQRNQEIQQWLRTSIDSIKGTGLTIDEFVKRSNQLEIINKVKDKYYERFTTVVEILNIMEIQGFEFKSNEEKQIKSDIQQESFQMQKRLEQLILTAEESADKFLEKYAKEVSNDLIPQLQKQAVELDNKIQDNKFLSGKTSMEDAIKDLDELSAQMQVLLDKSKLYNQYERTLQLPMTRWEELEETQMDLFLRSSMWKSLKEWQELTAKWIDGQFTDIQVDLIKSKAEIYTKVVQKCVKRLPGNPILEKLKNKVYDFKETMPVVVALRNPELKDYHWKEIKQIIGKDFVIDDDFTLRKLINLGVVENSQEIQDIATQATQEAVLEKSYQEQLKKWESLQFVISPYSRSKDGKKSAEAHLLDAIDDLFNELDDLLSNVNNILGSRYLKKIREDVDKLQKKILFCQETLDNWVNVQKNWIYFDNIFASNDIRSKLPNESQAFDHVDKFFKKQMNQARKHLSIYKYMNKGDIKKEWIKSKDTFNSIQKSLDNLLEDKRSIFPRFYFLSNDELLEILAKSQDRGAIQKNIKKCFDGISKLIYHQDAQNLIVGMQSPENEEVFFTKNQNCRGEVEVWLLNVQEAMKETMIKKMKNGRADFDQDTQERHIWVMNQHPAQVICTVSQASWTYSSEVFIQQVEKDPLSLDTWLGINIDQLEHLTKLITQKDLPKLKHKCIVALITQDVHARDIVENLYQEDVCQVNDFLWQKQLRYYWDEDLNDGSLLVKQVNSTIKYGFEYLGATTRLVITPLTDRCWLTITGALNIQLGAAPAGPAGTGKTESTKDLGKGLGMLCVVFNCSEQIEYKMMGRLFAGLSEQGAWACLDEFNRIDIEVLSVIAQQLLTIRQALLKKENRFVFVNKEIELKADGYGVFITMNPGYAGRTELPDNLKVLFRPVSMMIPDYGLIAEIMLYAEGFESANSLSKKMVQLYKLSSEQLSQQDHYDFGMRAVKSVLNMAGSIKRQEPDENEDTILIKAMIDSNVPKFLKDDLPLFNALIQDLFPSTEIKKQDYGELSEAIQWATDNLDLQYVPSLETKVIQLFETFNVRFGVMLVGETTSGKTTCFKILQQAMTHLFKTQELFAQEEEKEENENENNKDKENPNQLTNVSQNNDQSNLENNSEVVENQDKNQNQNQDKNKKKNKKKDERYQEVLSHIINPKCISMGELYGEVNPYTQEWNDGLASSIMREAAADETEKKQWVVFDGPVDALWIENMNTVLDDNMTLCLANGQRIKLRQQMQMLFEVQDLKVASPATVSRCGMVYMVTEDLGWRPYVDSWLQTHFNATADKQEVLNQDYKQYLSELFNLSIETALQNIRTFMSEPIQTVNIQLVASLCNLLECFINEKFGFKQSNLKPDEVKRFLLNVFAFAFIWSMGATVTEKDHDTVNALVRDIFKAVLFPSQDQVFGYFLNVQNDLNFQHWSEITDEFIYNKEEQYFNLLVPTVDVCRYSFIIDQLISNQKNVYVTGPSGAGKSVLVQNLLKQVETTRNIDSVNLIFSAQTSSLVTQGGIESFLQVITKQKLGAKPSHSNVVFIDDINMPSVEKYGAQPPIELLRLFIDKNILYDRKDRFIKQITDTNLICVSAPPGGGRNHLTPRFTRHFNILCMPQPGQKILQKIFDSLLNGFFKELGFQEGVKQISHNLVNATIDVYHKILAEKLPIPSKFHYTFNLRDVSKVFQGIMMSQPGIVYNEVQMIRLWIHETSRVFHDRLINEEDRQWFYDSMIELLGRHFKPRFTKEEIFAENKIMFSDILRLDYGKEYEEIQDRTKLHRVLDEKMDDYNSFNSKNPMNLEFFNECIEHILRISRVLKQPRGNSMLIGVGGSGKQSLTKLASFMLGYQTIQVEMGKGYCLENFREFIQELMKKAGIEGSQLTFLFTDTQIIDESFLEDLNNILNSGEIPNLWNQELKSQVIDETRPHNAKLKRPEDPDTIYKTFVERVRNNLHIVLCMSPIGDALRVRCRQFPSLVDCCSLDWYSAWPAEALFQVAKRILIADENFPVAREKEKHVQMVEKIAEICKNVHISASQQAVKYEMDQRRKVYTTPKSYLDLIKQYQYSLKMKRNEFQTQQRRLNSGLTKLEEANKQVAELQITLTELKPKLEEKNVVLQQALVEVEKDAKIAAEQEALVSEETAKVQEQKDNIQSIADEAQQELDKCKPELDKAQQQVANIDRQQLTALRTMINPPEVVPIVFAAVCALFGMKNTDWATGKSLLNNIDKFMKDLLNYDKDNIPAPRLKMLERALQHPKFKIDEIAQKVSYAADIAQFCLSMKNYSDVLKNVKPKQQIVEKLSKDLAIANQELAQQQAELQKVQDRVQELKDETNKMAQEKEDLEHLMELTEKRLLNAKKLIELTADEKKRWEVTIVQLNEEIEKLFGDVFLASAEIAYNGPFTGQYRSELVNNWNEWVTEAQIPKSNNYNIVKVLGDPMLIREWMIQGLPSDQTSQENSVYIDQGYRWSLIIDPQIQAIKWLKNKEKENNLFVQKFSNPKFVNNMNLAIPNGYPVLIEDVDETIDPVLDTILSKNIYDADGRTLVKFADKEVDYHKDFRIYLTTKKPNPNYLPEIFIKVTVINFTATFEGLEDQLLAEVVKNEKPDVEIKRDENIKNLSEFRKKIEQSEKDILRLLAEANADTILDNVNLIQTLESSKETSFLINQKIKDSAELEKVINETRNKYRRVSIRGSLLYFVIKDLALIDPMYQYSLQYIQKLFVYSLTIAEKSNDLEHRLDLLIQSIMTTIFTSVSRGLFEKDKPIFSFLITTSINMNSKILDPELWGILLKGAPVQDVSKMPQNPDPNIITSLSWELAYYLEQNFQNFKDLQKNIEHRILKWREYVQSEKPLDFTLPEKWDKLDPFEKMMIVKIFRPEKLMFAVQRYVGHYLGKFFLEFPVVSMNKVHADSDNKTPIIFVLSQGADPTQQIVNFAQQSGMQDKLIPKSLGQGQGEIASQLINQGKEEGNWVFLMNCHLSKTWMPSLEQIVQTTMEEENVHPDYRLILTSMPADYFPVSVLQNGIKLTTEPPRGFKANLKRSWTGIDDNQLECENEKYTDIFHKIVWGLTYFHAIIQVRRKFGPLGWNIQYEFNDSDLETSMTVLKMLLQENDQIPWDSMQFITGHINYGGRVTDDWDRTCLITNLQRILLPKLLEQNYQFSESETYTIPQFGVVDQYLEYVEQLPIEDEPTVFGMHENANIAFQSQESQKIMETILSINSKAATISAGKSQDQVILELIESLLEELPQLIKKDDGNKELFEENEFGLLPSLSTVLLQEMARFKNLLDVIHQSLIDLKKAIAGLMVMSQDLDETYVSLINNIVPAIWVKAAYPSLKPLTSWYKDLKERINFINKWLQEGNPNYFWLSGLFFPQGFLTGVKQTHARKCQIPIDEIDFTFNILDVEKEEINFRPQDGVYIYGLFLEGAGYNIKKKTLIDSEPGQMTQIMPIIHFNLMKGKAEKQDIYRSPLYKTTARKGTLSTTGHSTNFILPIDLPTTEQPAEFWILRGTALVCSLNE